MDVKTCLALTVFTPNCSFQIEMERENINDILKDMDKSMTSINVKNTKKYRTELAMRDATKNGIALAENKINSTEAVQKIAFDFLYVFYKTNGKIKDDIIGIIASLTEEALDLNSYQDYETYIKIANIAKLEYDNEYGESEDKTPNRPTIH